MAIRDRGHPNLHKQSILLAEFNWPSSALLALPYYRSTKGQGRVGQVKGKSKQSKASKFICKFKYAMKPMRIQEIQYMTQEVATLITK